MSWILNPDQTGVVKNLPPNAGYARDANSIPGSGSSPRGGNVNPLQYSCLGNPMDRGAWWATVHRITELNTTEATLHTVQIKCNHYRCPQDPRSSLSSCSKMVSSKLSVSWLQDTTLRNLQDLHHIPEREERGEKAEVKVQGDKLQSWSLLQVFLEASSYTLISWYIFISTVSQSL